MESKAKMFGHAMHPILIVFPLGLLSTAAIFDVLDLVVSRRQRENRTTYGGQHGLVLRRR